MSVALSLAAAATIIGLIALANLSYQSQKGAEQRVLTISQRCDLTAKITDVLRKDDPGRVVAFEASYGRCLVGLKKAERLAGVSAHELEKRN